MWLDGRETRRGGDRPVGRACLVEPRPEANAALLAGRLRVAAGFDVGVEAGALARAPAGRVAARDLRALRVPLLPLHSAPAGPGDPGQLDQLPLAAPDRAPEPGP